MNQRVAVIGQAQSKFKRNAVDSQPSDMLYPVVYEALKAANLSRDEIDTVISASCDMQDGRSISNVFTCEATGAFMKEESKVEEDGAYAVYYTLMRILSGNFQTALVVAYGKGSECHPQWYTHSQCEPFAMRPLGLEGITTAALQASSYMKTYNITPEQVAAVAVKNRKAAFKNPYAQVKKAHTIEEVLESDILASPIHKYEAPPITDGACAVVLASEDFAKKHTTNPVFINGIGTINDYYYPGYRNLARPASLLKAAENAYEMAGIKEPRKEIDIAEVYDGFAHWELMLYEGLKFCPEGGGGALLDEGATQFEGDLPVNPSGGCLSAHPIMAAGLVRFAEAYLQLTGKAGERQIKNANKAVVHATSGLALQSNIVFVMGRD